VGNLKILVNRKPGTEDIPLPQYQTEGAAGMDIHSAVEITLYPGDRALISTGLRVALPPGHELQIRSRSGMAAKEGLFVLNSPGTVDEDFRGELVIILLNTSGQSHHIPRGTRIAQAVLCPVTRADGWEEVDELPPSRRGEGGLGSTGR
jgi:dUTP pyrophosphatase